jgi:nicotinate-nucleotide pyrophosphorylase (carboxylating)
MTPFTDAERIACEYLIELALAEDLGPRMLLDGDVTSVSFIDADRTGSAALVARKPGVLAGLPAAAAVFARVDREVTFQSAQADGAMLNPGDQIAVVHGRMRSILAAERTALNFVQHLSGIATLTRQFVEGVAGTRAKILDTRKTLPGWRLLAKYAVRQGGGHNHRMGLFDMALIKDNHWSAWPTPRDLPGRFRAFRVRDPGVPIEIEVDSLAQLDEVLPAAPDIVLLDNMTVDQTRDAVRRRNAAAPPVLLEASGGITLATVRSLAETGVDRISVGALTHSAPALDIALDYQ